MREAVATLFHRNHEKTTVLKALDNISLHIGHGESVGLIGPNGAGKTTILKLLAGITKPSSGTIRTCGRVSSLIELGAGFHPDLTGRENIYLNATILGLPRRQIQRRFDAIVDFSELEHFLDTPVKRYSSGMYCRLGFSVAAFVDPDILLVDEVLAVGDAAFQAKCLKRMSELRAAGTTIIFVTHSLGYLQRLCQRAIFLYRGQVQADGITSEVIRTYMDHPSYRGNPDRVELDTAYGVSTAASGPISITAVYFTDRLGNRVEQARTGAPLNIHVAYAASEPVTEANVEIWLYGLDGSEYATFATIWDGLGPLNLQGYGEIRLQFDALCLMPGAYFVNAAISDPNGLRKYDLHWGRHRLIVLSGPISYGLLYQPHYWVVDTRNDNV
ncbi:MAG: ABC transporter ATP-binding protein [Chloroflexia bacterium]